MAAAIEIQRMLDSGSEYVPTGTQVTKNDTKFDEVFQKEIAVQNTTQSFTKLTDDQSAEDLAEKIMEYIFTGKGDLQELKKQFEALGNNMSRVDILGILQQIASYAINECSQTCPSGKTQDFINRLFFADGTVSAKPSPIGTSKILMDAIEKLNDDDKDNSDKIAELMASLTPNPNISADGLEIYDYQQNNVGFIQNSSVYSMPLDTIANKIMDVISDLVDVPKEQIFKNYFGEGNALVSNNFAADNNLLSGNAEIVNAVNAGTLTAGTTSRKLLAEGELLRASVLSKTTSNEDNDLSSILGSMLSHQNGQTSQISNNTENVDFEKLLASYQSFPIEDQIKQKILDTTLFDTNNGMSEFTMKLNPEELGEIVVKIQKTDDKVMVTLGAQSDITNKILQEKAPELISVIQQKEPDAKVIQVNASDTAYMEYLSQNFDRGQNNNNNSSSYSHSSNGENQNVENENEAFSERGVNKLWQTA